MSHYQDDFYADLHQQTLYPARTILAILLKVIPAVRSAVDVGCAVGSWLSVLRADGVEDIQGIDGDWVNRDFLEIPKERFRSCNLDEPFAMDRKFDLAMSLEVAEHLPETSAAGFVHSLTCLADFVLFSAAIPHQGGTNHVNEQWPDYWVGLFADNGFIGVDCIRRRIWNDAQIPFWYKQNLLLFVRRERLAGLQLAAPPEEYAPIALVHPEQYLSGKVAQRIVKESMKQKLRDMF